MKRQKVLHLLCNLMLMGASCKNCHLQESLIPEIQHLEDYKPKNSLINVLTGRFWPLPLGF